MGLGSRIKNDTFLRFTLAQLGITASGVVVLAVIGRLAVPGITDFWLEFIPRAAAVAFVLGVFAVAMVFKQNQILRVLSRHGASGKLSDKTWEEIKKAACDLPQRLMVLTLIVWPLFAGLTGLWTWASGFITLDEAIRTGLCGLLYCPIQATLLFYFSRYSLRSMIGAFSGQGVSWFSERRGFMGLKPKLIMSYATLAVCPLFAGILLSEVQTERLELQRGLEGAGKALDYMAEQGATRSLMGRWEGAVAGAAYELKLGEGTRFQLSRPPDKLLAGEVKDDEKDKWLGVISREPVDGYVSVRVPGSRRYMVFKYFPEDEVWLSVSTDPFPSRANIFKRQGATFLLAVIIFVISIAMGYLAAEDVVTPVRLLASAAGKASRGDYEEVEGFLSDDELSDLAMGYNVLVASIRRELKRANQVSVSIRKVVSGLSEQADRIRGLADQERQVIDEQNALAEGAESRAELISQASESISDGARATKIKMDEVDEACLAAAVDLAKLSEAARGAAEANQTIHEEMEDLERNYETMEDVVGLIEEIADQAELLALNAELEAAGAGEGASRFMVVATEMRRLAIRTSEQTSWIRELFEALRESNFKMVQSIETGRKKSAMAPQRAEGLKEGLKKIQERSSLASDSMIDIVEMTDKQSGSLGEMKSIVIEIRTAAKIMDEVGLGAEKAVKKLNELSDNLNLLVSRSEDE